MTLKQQASIYAGAFLTLLVLGVVVKMGKGPDSIAEHDEMLARRDRGRLEDEKRVRPVRRTPEWFRRAVRRWNALGKAGEAKRLNGAR